MKKKNLSKSVQIDKVNPGGKKLCSIIAFHTNKIEAQVHFITLKLEHSKQMLTKLFFQNENDSRKILGQVWRMQRNVRKY